MRPPECPDGTLFAIRIVKGFVVGEVTIITAAGFGCASSRNKPWSSTRPDLTAEPVTAVQERRSNGNRRRPERAQFGREHGGDVGGLLGHQPAGLGEDLGNDRRRRARRVRPLGDHCGDELGDRP
jgi:hypothetical protein